MIEVAPAPQQRAQVRQSQRAVAMPARQKRPLVADILIGALALVTAIAAGTGLLLGDRSANPVAATRPTASTAGRSAATHATHRAIPRGLIAALARNKAHRHGGTTAPRVTYRANGGLQTPVPGGLISLTPTGFGRGVAEPLGSAVSGDVQGRRTYRFGSLSVWYRTSSRGIEQGFTIARPPTGNGSTVGIDMATAKSISAVANGPTSLSLDLRGRPTGITYSGLQVTDATGRVLPATLTANGRQVRISFDDSGATYPVTVDPWITLPSLDPPASAGSFGQSVAMSADGNTALVGDPGGGTLGKGEATIYHNINGIWTPGQALAVPSGAGQFGTSVALSSTATTALVGDPQGGPSGKGAATVYSLSGNTWSGGTSLTAPAGEHCFGFAVTLSGDGNTAVVGDPGYTSCYPYGVASTTKGDATAYTFNGASWSSGTTLPAPTLNSDYGASVSLSQDGKTAAVGDASGGSDNFGDVAVLKFTTSWAVSATLVEPVSDAAFGTSVALSSDGTMLVVGDPGGGAGVGYATVFTYTTVWTAASGSAALSVPPNSSFFGSSVAISGNDHTILVGDPYGGTTATGAVRAYIWTGAGWGGSGKPINAPTGAGEFGTSVAVSSSGLTALVGDPFATAGCNTSAVGAAYLSTYSGTTYSAPVPLATPQSGVGFGTSVAMSTDGSTAIVGDPVGGCPTGAVSTTNTGAATIYTRIGQTWGGGSALTVPPSAGASALGNSSFGTAVAISGSGTIALVGDPTGGTAGTGAATSYTYNGTGWSAGTALPTPTTTPKAFATSVALSSNSRSYSGASLSATKITCSSFVSGDVGAQVVGTGIPAGTFITAVIPGVWANVNNTLTTETNETISLTTTTALVGDPSATGGGAATVFSYNGTKWTQVAPLSPPAGSATFGTAVALSSDGKTAIVGDPSGGPGGTGIVTVYTLSGTTWSQSDYLVAPTVYLPGAFGTSVAISSNGTTAAVGDPSGGLTGAATIYNYSDGSWSDSPITVPAGTSFFGQSVAVSPDGTSVMVGDTNAVPNGGTTPTGDVYPYYLDGPVWAAGTPLTPPSTANSFGNSVAESTGGAYALVGDPGDGLAGGVSTFTAVGTPTQLAITSSAVVGGATNSATLGAFTVQLEDPLGNPVNVTSATTVNLSSTSSGAVFSNSSGGSPTTSVTIQPGNSSTPFFYGDTAAGTPTITAQSAGVARASQQETIVGGPASQLAITSAPTTATVGTSFNVTVAASDQYGNPSASYTGTVKFTSSDTAAALPGNYPFVAGDNGIHTFPVTLEDAGSQTVTVTDMANSSLTASASVTVAKAASTLTVSTNPSGGAVQGQTVTYSATVHTPGTQPATGTMTFTTGATSLCFTTTFVSNTASCTSSAAPLGSDTITATYGGNTNYNGSTGTTALSVGHTASSTAISVSPGSVTYGATVTYSVTVSGTGSTPTGSVTFTTGSTSLCTVSALSSGSGSCTSTAATGGSDTVTGTYSGDSNFAGSSGTTSLSVSQASSSTGINVSAPTVTPGTSVTYTATVTSGAGTPTGSVAFAVGSTSLCTATLSGGTGHCSSTAAPAGSDTVTGTYTGDTNFSGSQGTASLHVGVAPTITTTSLSGGSVGASYSATVVATGGSTPYTWSISAGSLPAGLSLDSSSGSITGTPQSAGTATFTVQVTDNASATATASLSIVVGKGAASVSASASPSTSTSGQSVTFSATVHGGGSTPTGTVTFTATSTLCTATVSGGTASCSATTAPTGSYSVTASYGGDGNYNGASGAVGISVTAPISGHGYWLVAGDGGIFTFGKAKFYGSTGNLHLQRPVVGMTPTADRGGYWMVATDGGMFAFGDAKYHGSIPGLGMHPAGSGISPELAAPIVAMVASPDGKGYLMVASDGGVFAFGDALFHGSCPGIGGCNGSVVAVVPDAGELGYWVVTSTGHVYAFGNAASVASGQPGFTPAPITGATASSDGHGYLVVDARGDVYNYGDAHKYGSAPGGISIPSSQIVGIVPTSTGLGYWLMGAAGAVFNRGDAVNYGSMAGQTLNAPIVTAAGF